MSARFASTHSGTRAPSRCPIAYFVSHAHDYGQHPLEIRQRPCPGTKGLGFGIQDNASGNLRSVLLELSLEAEQAGPREDTAEAVLGEELIAGELLRSPRTPWAKFLWLVSAGIVGLAAGWALDHFGICPIVKRIWTPSWTLYSAGWCALILAGFYGVVDMLGFRKWTFPLVVVGMNSITMYCMAQLLPGWIHRTLGTHFGSRIFEFVDEAYRPLVSSLWILLFMWLVCYWLYRQRIFIRI